MFSPCSAKIRVSDKDLPVVYDQNLHFGLGPILKPNPKLADAEATKGKSSYQWHGVFISIIKAKYSRFIDHF